MITDQFQVSCEKYVPPEVLSLSAQSDTASRTSTNKVFVDVCTNTPNHANHSTQSIINDDDETFFSLNSDRALVSDRSFVSPVASPNGLEPRQNFMSEKSERSSFSTGTQK
ncbi:hypothetical protein KIN20_010877 [Parelaphostrongylus tenuis]|uniref:Uncharacterized protein n=1 Tax=Parelaphostrongylus tenuis TaxID=148309 RepID=A0AAD5MSP7_PARTN|nr:hypothetical protein KIN20_010877 [Parelaphostrongylus tenuis]